MYLRAYVELLESGVSLEHLSRKTNVSVDDWRKKLRGTIDITVSEAKQFKKIIESDLPLEKLFKYEEVD